MLTVPRRGVDLGSTLGQLAVLPGDPTVRLEPGRFERATSTPDGPGAIAVAWDDGPEVQVETYGPGGGWLADRAPCLLGHHDDVAGFEPVVPPLRNLWRRHRGDRIARTGTLWHDLAWFVVQQRVSRPWTASCLATHTWGARDEVIVGDDGIPSIVAWLLARERRADDARMPELLEPYRPHRYRVVRLAFLSGERPPRHGPRGRPHDIRHR